MQRACPRTREPSTRSTKPTAGGFSVAASSGCEAPRGAAAAQRGMLPESREMEPIDTSPESW